MPKTVFVLMEIILNKTCVYYVIVLFRDVFEEYSQNLRKHWVFFLV